MGVAYCGVDVVNDTDIGMVVDSMIVVTQRGTSRGDVLTFEADVGDWLWLSQMTPHSVTINGSGEGSCWFVRSVLRAPAVGSSPPPARTAGAASPSSGSLMSSFRGRPCQAGRGWQTLSGVRRR